ncbi:MAG: sugar ABC transporter permease [Spirochaetota bacterium]
MAVSLGSGVEQAALKEREIIGDDKMAKPSLKSQKRSEAIWAYLMIAPLFAGILLFFYGSMIYSFIISFTDFNPIVGSGKWLFLENYQKIFSDRIALKSLGNTLKFVLLSVPLLVCFSIVVAILISNQGNRSLRLLLQIIFFIPNITLPVALSLAWRYIFNPVFGIVNNSFSTLGLPLVNWFTSPAAAFIMIVIFVVWQGSGYCILLLSIAIQNIPAMYYEAGLIEGAGPRQLARYITIPLISPTIFFLVITATIGIFQIFDPIVIITKGGPVDSTRSIMFSIYNEIGRLKIGFASAMSWLLFFIIMLVTLVQSKGQKKWVHYDL